MEEKKEKFAKSIKQNYVKNGMNMFIPRLSKDAEKIANEMHFMYLSYQKLATQRRKQGKLWCIVEWRAPHMHRATRNTKRYRWYQQRSWETWKERIYQQYILWGRATHRNKTPQKDADYYICRHPIKNDIDDEAVSKINEIKEEKKVTMNIMRDHFELV